MLKLMYIRTLGAVLIAAHLTGGCAQQHPLTEGAVPLRAMSNGRSGKSLDAPQATQTVFTLDVSILTVPYGTFSSNEAFWKNINEHTVDPGTYDLLYRSGVRVGDAPRSELAALDKYLDTIITRQKSSVTGTEVKNMLIPMKKDIPEQDVFHVNKFNENVGRTYHDSDNFINISFEPAIRKPGQVRITCCPMVKSTVSFQRATPMNQTWIITKETPEVLYDLNFKVDLAPGNFLIAMPSPDVTTSNVGGRFFTTDGTSERMEQVLLIMMVAQEIQIGKAVP